MRRGILLFLAFLLFSALSIVDFTYSETTEENLVYIRSDGSIDPSIVPIERIGNIYKFSGDIQGSIIIEKDNVVIDGAGFTLQGTNASDYRPAIPEFDITQMFNQTIRDYDETILPQSNNTGIYSYKQKLTIMNLKITEFWCAIELEDSSDNSITDNEIINNTQGVWIHSSSNNTISGNNVKGNKQGLTLTTAYSTIHYNNITENSEYGIKLFWSFNTLSENEISNNGFGVSFEQSTHNIFRNNSFNENNRLFYYSGSSFHEFIQDVDTSNLANGKPIYFWENKKDLSIPTNAGYVALINCNRIRVEGLNLDFGQQILLVSTTDSIVIQNVMTHNQVCIYLKDASNNIITENILTNSNYGIMLEGCTNNIIKYNNLKDNFRGIELSSSQRNNIQNNQITNNSQGVSLIVSTNNVISINNLTSNDCGLYFNRRLSTMNMSDQYNSTIIYGCSNNKILNNQIDQNNFGIWMSSATNNTIAGNNFIDNIDQIILEDSTSFLDTNGIDPKESRFASVNYWDDNQVGNYWNNYIDIDNDGDGIGDTPYIIDENNLDNYPLMNRWTKPTELPELIPLLIITAIIISILVASSTLLIYFKRIRK